MRKLFFVLVFLLLTTSIYGETVKRKKMLFPPDIVVEPKSQKKALALSLLLPGLGEQYMGHKKDAIRAYAIEATIWSVFFGARWYAGVLADNYTLYAHSNSGAHTGKDEEYYEHVEWYQNLEAYNTGVREEARSLYPNSRENQQKYIDEHSLSNTLAWDWTDEKKWGKYQELRKERRTVLQHAGYCVGVAILNRISSAIIATHLPESGLGLQIEPNGLKIRFALRQ